MLVAVREVGDNDGLHKLVIKIILHRRRRELTPEHMKLSGQVQRLDIFVACKMCG